jgi:phospholipid/cholesterol/gamma-HCH transport system substrate-binding protein
METRAPYLIVGAFVLMAIFAVFGFVYWLNNAGGLGKRDTYQLVFNGPVPGLLVGAAVLFNGIRVGEVSALELVTDHPHDVHVTIAVAQHTPVRADTRVGLDFQGLTGVPVVALEGGDSADASPVRAPLVAEKGAGQSMTQAARDALRRVDSVLSDNATPLHKAIGNIDTFAEALARNSSKLDGIVTGLERMTGATPPPRKTTYDLQAVGRFDTPHPPLQAGLAITEPTATARLQSQRFLFANGEEGPDDFANAQWSDTLPALVQTKLLQSFENYDIDHAPLRADSASEGGRRLLIDLRQFEINGASAPSAAIAVSAKLVDGSGQLQAARVFEEATSLDGVTPAKAALAFNRAFDALARKLVLWTVAPR